jgi:hypothetical protein
VRRIQACVNMDIENKEFASAQPDGQSEFMNMLIRGYRSNAAIRTMYEGERLKGITKGGTTEEALQQIASAKIEEEQKIRAYLHDMPHIIYMAKTQRKYTKADLCKIKDELYYSKYNVDATTDTIRRVLKEEISKFDVNAYEEDRGIMRKK